MILIVTSHAAEVTVWLDGIQMPDTKPKQGRREYELPVHPPKGEQPPMVLRTGKHLLAVRAKPPVVLGKPLMMAGLYPERRPDLPAGAPHCQSCLAEELTEKLVTQRRGASGISAAAYRGSRRRVFVPVHMMPRFG